MLRGEVAGEAVADWRPQDDRVSCNDSMASEQKGIVHKGVMPNYVKHQQK